MPYDEEKKLWKGEPSPEPKRVWDDENKVWKTVSEWDNLNLKWVDPE